MTTLTDIYGHELTIGDLTPGADTNPAAFVDRWADISCSVLGHKVDLHTKMASLLNDAPQFAYGWAVMGLGALVLARRELVDAARNAHEEAVASLQEVGGSERERVTVEALGLMLEGRWRAGADKLDQALNAGPRDALLLKLVHSFRFMIGDARGMRRSIETVLDEYPADHPHAGYVYGCYAFALEETGVYSEAEAWGKRGLDINNDDAWGLHAVTHVYEMQVDTKAGLRWLEDNRPAWSDCNNFGGHVWWHMALFYLEEGDTARALALYDDEVRADQTDDFRDISNGASLLQRLELEGVDVGERWDELADKSAARTNDACLAFADLHYMLSLLGAGRMDDAEALIGQLANTSATDPGDLGVVARKATHKTALGLLAFKQGDYKSALDAFVRANPELYRIGGSHAQRDVFKWVMTEAALRAGRGEVARELIKERTGLRGSADRFALTRLERINEARGAQAAGLGAAITQMAAPAIAGSSQLFG
ncbi:MAG: tetratricopeptide repeat protein [Alphaproteobacteria bacterium]|nr:tetratricopeptide repeat protein [Alphaproteobacteria bacterium SS10]